MNIQILLTGDELMAGDIIDSNSATISQALTQLGVRVSKRITLGDEQTLLAEEIDRICNTADILIINGGLGPTVDDLTALVLSQVTKKPLVEHPDALSHLQQWCDARNITLNAANLKQALLPKSAEIIPNPIGSAVGIKLMHKNCLILSTPGVPKEMEVMLQESIIPSLKKQLHITQEKDTLRLKIFGFGESSLQQLISDSLPHWPKEVILGFKAGFPLLELKLTIKSKSDEHLRSRCLQELKALVGNSIVGECKSGEPDLSFADIIVKALKSTKQTLTTAESCTGGLIASQLTAIPGSSAVFEAGFVTYSNTIKQTLLDVPAPAIKKHGAVSEEVVIAMAEGALAKSHSDYAIAVSGIAGPDGECEDKPVGTVWIAWGKTQQIKTVCLFLPIGRKMFQKLTAAAAFDLIRRDILNIESPPRWLNRYKK